MPYGMMNAVNQAKTNNAIRASNQANRVAQQAIADRDWYKENALKLVEINERLKNSMGLKLNPLNPLNAGLQRSRIVELSKATYGDLGKLTTAQRRDRVLDVIAWTDFMVLTEWHILEKIERVVAKAFKNNMVDDYDMRSVLHEGNLANEAKKAPEAWVANRKKELMKTVKYQYRNDIVPLYSSFGPTDAVASEMKQNVLEYSSSPESKGIYNIVNGIIRYLMP